MTVYETQNDGSVKESTSIFDDETLYFEFYDNGMYSMFGVPDGHWEILNGNKLYIEGRNFIYTILFLKSTEMELELVRDVNRRDVYYFVKKN